MSDLVKTPERLKQSILQEAMQGKLTKQLPSDGNADDLLQSIRHKKLQLIQAGKIRKHKKLLPINNDEIPFRIPKNWEWTRLGNICSIENGDRGKYYPSKKYWVNSGVPFLNAGSLNKNGTINMKNIHHITTKRFNLLRSGFIHKGDILYTLRGSIGKASLDEQLSKGAIASSLTIIHSYLISSKFLILVFLSDLNKKFLNSIKNGTAQPNVSASKLINFMIPLPPLAEQHRIIQHLNEISPKVDDLNKDVIKLDSIRTKFPHRLKQSLLLEAMKGHLTQQLPSDGNADDLLQKIQQKKQQLIQAGKIRRHKKLPPISKNEIPFKIPKNWKWVRLNSVGSWKSGSTPKRSNPNNYNGNIPWLKTGDLTDSYINETSEHISAYALNNSSLRINPIGSILIAMYGATIGKLGISHIKLTTNQACCACVPYLINNKFLFYYLLSQRDSLIKLGAGGAQPNISRTKIIHYPFPLPPLPEQHRIVSKLHDLFDTINA